MRPQLNAKTLDTNARPPYLPRSLCRDRPVRMASDVVHSDPDILGGIPVFVGTRVPLQTLFDYLEGGDTLDEFLHQFPSVSREQALAALALARDSLLARARSV